MISFIIPAHNEAFELPRTLRAVFASARDLGRPFEVIVVNDVSTDNTRRIAENAGARVVDVQLRKISAVRNAGAEAAKGTWLFFVDADTQITPQVVGAAVRALDNGAVGGGAWVNFAEPMGPFIRGALWLFSLVYMRFLKWAAGCFVYARRDAFEGVGGFDETLYASEEIELSKALKRRGSFVVLREPVTTSGRKMRLYSIWAMVPFALRFLLHGKAVLKRPNKGLDWWYEGKRESTLSDRKAL